MYRDFAYIYDKLMYDVNYTEWVDYLEKIFIEYNKKPQLILDLGCGTGSLCIELGKRGYDMIGIDLSSDMLNCAREKSEHDGLDILFLNQDMRQFELYGTVDVVLCMMDSLNYVTNPKDVLKVFKLVNNYLNPGGLFVFDINSAYKLENVLGNEVFFDDTDEVTYIWQNNYNKRSKICQFDLTFFVKKDESYEKYTEVHYEKAYSIEELKECIEKSGLVLKKVLGDFKFKKPSKTSQRIFFVCEKSE